jgi:hypothetical protein
VSVVDELEAHDTANEPDQQRDSNP